MEPAFHRGDLLFLTNRVEDPIRVGEIVVFRIEGREIPIVHRVLKIHEKYEFIFWYKSFLWILFFLNAIYLFFAIRRTLKETSVTFPTYHVTKVEVLRPPCSGNEAVVLFTGKMVTLSSWPKETTMQSMIEDCTSRANIGWRKRMWWDERGGKLFY